MTKPTQFDAICSFCQASYRIGQEHIGRVATCKKCGKKIKLLPSESKKTPQDQQSQKTPQSQPQQAQPQQSQPQPQQPQPQPQPPQKTQPQKPQPQPQQPQKPQPQQPQPQHQVETRHALSLLDVADLKLIRMAVQYGFISKEKIQQAISIFISKGYIKKSNDLIPFMIRYKLLAQNEVDFLRSVQHLDDITEKDKLFGEIAIKNGLLSHSQISNSFKEQNRIFKQSGEIKLIGDILVGNGDMSPEFRDALLASQNRLKVQDASLYFGAIAISEKYITVEQLNQALEAQLIEFEKTQTIKLLGDILVDSGVLNFNQRKFILNRQKELRRKLATHDISTDTRHIGTKTDGINTDKTNTNETDETNTDETNTENVQVPKTNVEPQTNDPAQSAEQAKPEPPDQSTLSESTHEISVSDDMLKATIIFSDKIPEKMTVANIKSLILDKGITYGIVPDDMIASYISDKSLHSESWVIAQGDSPIQPVDDEVKFYFDQTLKKGTVRSDGAIDFKDRGVVPQVKKDDVLIERIPGTQGKPGINVYGELIEAKKPSTYRIRCGRGAELSSDNNKAIAKNSGIPKFDNEGKITVIPELTIQGDVNMKTGHVVFDGTVIVRGVVEIGFKVKAEILQAHGLIGSDVETTSDIIISGGIISSKVKCGGKLNSKFIKSSNVNSIGSIKVDREILDSTITTQDECAVSGRILASQIKATYGIDASEIGSDNSPPSYLTIGSLEDIDAEIKSLADAIQQKKIELDTVEAPLKQLKQEIAEIDQQMKGLQDFVSQIIKSRPTLQAKLHQLQKAKSKEFHQTESMMKNLELKCKAAQNNYALLNKKKKEIAINLEDLEEELKSSINQIKIPLMELEEAHKNKMESIKDKKISITIHKQVFRGTVVNTPSSTQTFTENRSYATATDITPKSQK